MSCNRKDLQDKSEIVYQYCVDIIMLTVKQENVKLLTVFLKYTIHIKTC